jgi:hypothetical protein
MLNRLGADPFLHMGLGLLGASGPSPMPISTGQALQRGLLSAQRAQQMRMAQDMAGEKMAMERKREGRAVKEAEAKERAAAARAAQEQASMAAKRSLLIANGMPPEQADQYVAAGLAAKQLEPPEQTTFARNMAALGINLETPEGLAKARELYADRGKSNLTVNTGPAGYQPQTQLAKTGADLEYWMSQPPSPHRDRMVASLRGQLSKPTQPTAEQGAKEMKFKTTLDAAKRLVALAEANEGSVGPIEGRFTEAKGAIGFGTEVQGEMRALDATMRSMLGTALSGAAIPETEWPTYMAQLPLLTDSPSMRNGKLRALEGTLAFLDAEAKRQRGQGASPAAAAVPAAPAAPAVSDPDLLRASDEDLLRMLSPVR